MGDELWFSYEVSERRASNLMRCPRSSYRYRSTADDQVEIRIRLRDLTATRVKFGYRRLHLLLQREGWAVNHKLIFRLYQEEGLSIPRRRGPRRHHSAQTR